MAGDDDWIAQLAPHVRANSRSGFNRICDVFTRWPPGAARTRELERVRGLLGSWSDEARIAFTSEGGLTDVTVLVRTLEIYRRGHRGSAELSAVALSPYVDDLVCLRILNSDVTEAAWRTFVDSPRLGGLRRLDVRATLLGDDALGALLRSGRHPGLTALELAGVGLEANALVPTVPGVPFPRLERLDLYGNILGDEGALRLAAAPWIAPVRRLLVGRNQLTARGVEALLRLDHLRELDARANPLGAGDRAALTVAARRRGVALTV
ncbi:hypothetical protein [Actinoplanes sp. HUAS TT8]|uniref:hypothetical protein n=1 Tax=Actinoplanes sp. HUAS TT8 TaxID=3447453 RepID=UPI003F522A14